MASPRLVAYCCKHMIKQNDQHSEPDSARWLSMLMLSKPGQKVTHVNLGQWWWAPDRSQNTLFYNDDAWTPPAFSMKNINARIFAEVKDLQANGIKVLAMLTFFWTELGFGQDGDFNEHLYGLLYRMILDAGFDGVDLDVEDFNTDNNKITKLIKRLKKDFGKGFLITMCPGGGELLPGRNLSGVDYKTLYESVGDDIDWFNVQCYNSWGELSLSDFESFVKAGGDTAIYPAHKIVMSVATNLENSAGDWTDKSMIENNLPEILAAYPDMGGLSAWEWYNSTLEDKPGSDVMLQAQEWFQFVHKLLRPDTGDA